ncbi:hypothetical protein MVEN_00000400 [Mycena venus]|uniref:Uncharacterized protein n=1 Tax=Mycena venus TaxID=2733690 RepID=A0A8H6Z6X7_9AGAR|nr:hypothetical protein MVEN_00000400 [Mycena venus]
MSQSLSHSRSPGPDSPSPPGTPDTSCDHIAHLKSLILLCAPRKSGRELAELRAKLSASVDDEGRVVQHLKHRLIDVENEASNPNKRSRRSRNHRTEGIEEQTVELTATELETRARQTGRKFVILCGLWLCLADDDYDAFFKADPDDEYDAELRFNSDDDIRQGQLREVLDILPDDLMPFRKRTWLAQAFKDGMNSQRSHTRTRLRKDVHHIVPEGIPAARVATQQSRIQHFRSLIGWDEEKNRYSIWNVPFLHGNESATLDFDEVFRHPVLLKIFACIIRGSASADGVMRGTSRLPRANVMQRIHHIEYTMPGAIVDSAIWAIWLFSGDEDFLPTGDFTAINYRDRHDEYLDKILEGLRRQQKWARDLFVFWDSHLFPSTNGSHYGGGVQQDHEEDRGEIEDATDAMLNMPTVSDAEDEDEVD